MVVVGVMVLDLMFTLLFAYYYVGASCCACYYYVECTPLPALLLTSVCTGWRSGLLLVAG